MKACEFQSWGAEHSFALLKLRSNPEVQARVKAVFEMEDVYEFIAALHDILRDYGATPSAEATPC